MAGGEAEATIVTKVVKDLLGDAAEGAARDGADDLAKDGAQALAKDGAEDLGKKATDDLGRDVTDVGRRETGDPLKDGKNGTPPSDRTATKDPIDVATGEVLLAQTDLTLPGVLPLALERAHVSSYRQGGLFGVSWASTLDQRLEVSGEGVWYAAPDGTIAAYPPILMAGVGMAPATGPLRPLTFTGDGYTIHDPKMGRTLHFPSPGGGHGWSPPLAAVTDRNGNRIEFVRDDSGTLREVRHSGGYRVGVETDDGRVTALRLLNAADRPVLKRFGYDGAGRLTEVYDGAADRPTRFEYDAAGRMTRWTDTNGHWYAYTYDEHGRAVAGEGPDGYLSTTLTYHDRTTVVTDSLGHATTYHLNERGQITATTDPLGNTTWSEWDPRGRLLSRTDPLSRTTRCTYDEAGNLTSITRPDGTRIEAVYNALCLPTEVIEPDGARWRHTYDERGNLVRLTDPLGAPTTYDYDERGAVVSVTDALGASTRVENDEAGLPVAVVDPLGAVTRHTRDAFGRSVAVTDPLGGLTRMDWTLDGRITRRILPDGSSERWTYDDEGNLLEHEDAVGNTTRYEVTVFDRTAAQTGPDGTRQEFSHDTELRLTTVTNPQGLTWRYAYDAAGNLVSETDFNGREVRYRHDRAGQLVERVNGAGEAVHYAHDALGNLVERRSGDGITTYSYDAVGRLIRAVNPDADVRFHRDPVGRVTAESCNGRVLTSVYDPVGQRLRRYTPSGAESVWEYDAAGHAVALHTAGQTVRFERDLAGREVRRDVGFDVALTQTWDAAHRLTGQSIWKAAASRAPVRQGQAQSARQAELLNHRAYRYRPDGLVSGVHDSVTGTRRFELDAAGRVMAAYGGDWTERYAYDTAGNLTQATWPADQRVASAFGTADMVGGREYEGTLIRHAGGVRYAHDAQGRVVLRQHKRLSSGPLTWRYHWNSEDRLVALETPDGQVWRYRYDALGRRISKQRTAANGHEAIEQFEFVWDGVILAEQAHSRQAPDGTPAVRATAWEWEPDAFRPVSQTERVPLNETTQQWVDQQFYAIVADLVGSPAETVDTSGRLVWRLRTTIWGTEAGESPASVTCPLRFPGQYRDAESGLNYNYHRYYDPALARYESSDPIGLLAAPNPYAYVTNPSAWIDPLGLAPYYSALSAHHVYQHGHAANAPRIAGKSRFRVTEGGQKFTHEVVNHPSVTITHQGNGRVVYEVPNLGRGPVGWDRYGAPAYGGRVIVEGSSPMSWSTYSPDEVVTQFPI